MLYVLSSGRASPNIQHTLVELRDLAPRWRGRTALVVPKRELAAYDHVAKFFGVLLLDCPVDRIGPTRQWCVEQGHETIFMVDDDMKFFRREDPEDDDNLKLRSLKPGELDEALDTMQSWLDGDYAHVGMVVRNNIPGKVKLGHPYHEDCSRANNLHGIHCPTLLDHGIRYDAVEVMEDFYVTLSLLTRRMPNRIMTEFSWNQRGSGKEGGCSQYRDAAVQERSALRLRELFPAFVKVVTRDSSSQWDGMESRVDVQVQWKKAFNES